MATRAKGRGARKGRTTRDEVVAAGVAVLDAVGEPELTMAAVASELGLTTMAIYRHVRDRADLLAHAVDRVLGDLADPAEPELAWEDGVVAWMHDVRRVMLRHPWVGPLIGTDTTVSAGWLGVVVRLLKVLDRSPLALADRARAAVWVARTTTGIVSQEVLAPLPDATRDPAGLLLLVDLDDRAAVSDVVHEIATVTNDELFDIVVGQARRYLGSLAP